MIKKEFMLCLVVFLIGILSAAETYSTGPDKVWEKRFSGPSNLTDEAFVVSVNSNRNVFVTGWSAVTSTNHDIITIRYNPDTGDSVWVKRFEGGYDDIPLAMTCDNNAVYVTGCTFASSNRNIVVLKYDAATGDTLWVKRYNGPGNGGDYAFSIFVDGAGNVYAAGRTDVSGLQKFVVLKFDASGNIPSGWPAIYSAGISNNFDEAHSVKVDNSGNVYVTGLSGSSTVTTTHDYMTLKINSSGIVQWAKKYNGNANTDDNAVALVLDAAQSNIFVSGYSSRLGTNQDFVTIKYNSNGDSIAAAIYNSPSNGIDLAASMTIDASDNIYLTGPSAGSGTFFDYATIAYNSNLGQLWVSRYVGPSGDDVPKSIAFSQGFVYVTGSSLGSGTGTDFLTVRYNASNGAESWNKRENYEASGNDAANSIAILDSNSVFVTGSAAFNAPAGTDYLTIRYTEPVGIRPISTNVPSAFELMQNYPNPFNPSTAIRFNVPKYSFVRLSVFDITGREVTVMANENLRAGEYEATWNASGVSSGVYFYRLTAGDFVQTRKMALIK